jgi:hypothetical protein
MLLLTDLKEQMERLPKKKLLKNITGGMKRYGALVTEAATSLKNVLDGVRLAQTVFPEEDFGKVYGHARQATSLAAKLKKRLTADINALTKSATEQDVTRLRDQAKAAHSALKERWNKLLSDRILPHEKLVEVVREIQELAPQGGARLGALLDDLRRQVSHVPANQKEADSIREGLEDLPRVIETLGLMGEVGDFLVQAAMGSGDPKRLYQPAIRDFFENRSRQRPLWDLIRVKIR